MHLLFIIFSYLNTCSYILLFAWLWLCWKSVSFIFLSSPFLLTCSLVTLPSYYVLQRCRSVRVEFEIRKNAAAGFEPRTPWLPGGRFTSRPRWPPGHYPIYVLDYFMTLESLLFFFVWQFSKPTKNRSCCDLNKISQFSNPKFITFCKFGSSSA